MHGAFLNPVILIVVGVGIGLALGLVAFVLLPWGARRVHDARLRERAAGPWSSPGAR